MARKIVWSIKAAVEKDDILRYWLDRNKSKSYPKKLNLLFHQATKWLSKNPYLGRRTSADHVRAKLVRGYFLFYKFDEKNIYVLTIWDARRNPDKIPFRA